MSVFIDIAPQPDDRTCGATCLHALYRHAGLDLELRTLTEQIPQLPDGGTLGVHLAIDALERGFEADIYTYNLQLFDPTWFDGDVNLADRLHRQRAAKDDYRIADATSAYLRYLELGGRVHFKALEPSLVFELVARGPLLVGLSATYLYDSMREVPETDDEDDIRGLPVGHFVLLEAGSKPDRRIHIADPWGQNPIADGQHYTVDYDRLIAAILLSIVTYDANLVAITQRT